MDVHVHILGANIILTSDNVKRFLAEKHLSLHDFELGLLGDRDPGPPVLDLDGQEIAPRARLVHVQAKIARRFPPLVRLLEGYSHKIGRASCRERV